MSPCPSEDVFVQLLEHGLDAPARDQLEAHLDRCPRCSGLLAQLQPISLDPRLARTPHHVGPSHLDAGDRLDRYVIIERIGRGGLGMVYAAHDTKLDRAVAIKTLLQDSLPADVRIARLRREARLLARCAHPVVVPIYDVGLATDIPYIVMELVRGQTLGAWIELDRPSVAEIVDAYAQVAQAIATAHALPVIHRDIKPSNIMRTDGGRIRLLDLGCAADADHHTLDAPRDADRRRSGPEPRSHGVGTPAYMAPEQWHGTADPASDQFSLCVSLYEGLFGCRPFAAGTEPSGIPSHPRPPNISSRLEAVLLRGLSIDPAARWASVGHLHDALLRCTAPRRARRRWWPWALAGACALLPIIPSSKACEDEAAAWASTWAGSMRPQLLDAFADSDAPQRDALFAHASSKMDAYVQRWGQAQRDACTAAPRPDILACLGRQRDQADIRIAALLRNGIDDSARAAEAFDDLAEPSRCADDSEVARLSTRIDTTIATTLAQLDARLRTGQRAGLLTAALELRDATTQASAATQASVHALVADVYMDRGQSRPAAEHYEQAFFAAGQARLPRVEARSAVMVLLALGNARHFEPATQWAEHARAAVANTPDPSHERALLSFALGQLAFEQGDPWAPLDHFEAAERMWTRVPERGQRWIETLHVQAARLASVRGEHDDALVLIGDVAAAKRRVHGDQSPLLVPLLVVETIIQLDLHRTDHAMMLLDEARAISRRGAEEHPLALSGVEQIACITKMRMWPPQIEQARRHCTESFEIRERVLGPDALATATVQRHLAKALRLDHDYDAAITNLERVRMTLTARLEPDHRSLLTTLLELSQVHGLAGHRQVALDLVASVEDQRCEHEANSRLCRRARQQRRRLQALD